MRPTGMRTSVGRSALLVGPLLVLGLAACGDDTDPVGPPDDSTEEPATAMDPTGSWVMIDGPVAPVEGWDVTVTIEDDRIGGTAACNQYGGTVAWSTDGAMTIDGLSQTEMACEPTEVMELEQAFLSSLLVVDAFAVDDEGLTLQGGGETWRFEELPPVPTAELVGTRWQLDGYVDGDAVSNEPGMESATLVLHPDGSMTGTTNCRRLTGTWIESGARVLLTELSAEGDCPDPAASDLDHRILGVLGDGFTATVDGNHLTLTSQGGVGLTYTAD